MTQKLIKQKKDICWLHKYSPPQWRRVTVDSGGAQFKVPGGMQCSGSVDKVVLITPNLSGIC